MDKCLLNIFYILLNLTKLSTNLKKYKYFYLFQVNEIFLMFTSKSKLKNPNWQNTVMKFVRYILPFLAEEMSLVPKFVENVGLETVVNQQKEILMVLRSYQKL